jgi:DNA mismatch repair protein MSH6
VTSTSPTFSAIFIDSYQEIYLVQVSAKEKAVPKNWTKNGGTKVVHVFITLDSVSDLLSGQAVTRYVVPELAKDIRSLKEARETRTGVVKDFKLRVFAEFDADREVWLRAIKTIAELDCLFSLAKASSVLGEPMCRPEFVESDAAFVDFEELRHPALCLKATDFIPNDVKLGGDSGKVALLTGPNMG